MVNNIKNYFKDGKFRAPATEMDIIYVEKELGIKIPKVLRELYLSFDGFRESIGNAAYLIPLIKDDCGSVISTTKFYWNEYCEYYPNLDFRNYMFFGSSCSDESWAINLQNETEIIAYHYHMEDEYEIVGDNIYELYIQDQMRYSD